MVTMNTEDCCLRHGKHFFMVLIAVIPEIVDSDITQNDQQVMFCKTKTDRVIDQIPEICMCAFCDAQRPQLRFVTATGRKQNGRIAAYERPPKSWAQ